MDKSKKVLGCAYWFEAYLKKSTLTEEMWNNTLAATISHLGYLRELKVVLHVENNLVRYFFGANKDLADLSNALDKVSLRPVDTDEINPPVAEQTEWLVQLVEGGNILDVREKVIVNRKKSLEWAVFSVREFLPKKYYSTFDLLFTKPTQRASVSRKRGFMLPGAMIAINFRENEKYAYKKYTKHLDIKKSLHILKNKSDNSLLEVDTYPYMPQNAYLNLSSYDFDKHSFIVGASGSGKSKFISLFVDRLLNSPQSSQYRVVVIDPHASLEQDLSTISDVSIVNFRSSDDSTGLFAESNTDVSAATELTASLFESLLGASYTTAVDRTLRYSTTTLMTAQIMSLAHLRQFLTDDDYRAKILQHVNGFVSDSVMHYFEKEYPALYRNQYSQVVMPIAELVDEIALRSLGGAGRPESSLAQVVSANRLTVFSLNKVAMGEKVIKTVAGLLIQQLFLLAQGRQFNEKVILIIDEVSVIQNPTIAQILAEARKYNLFVFLSQQYFGQVDESLQNAIFSNVSNYYVFKVSEQDARTLEGNITMELPRKMTMEATRTIMNEEDKRVPILTSLDMRECVVRVSSGGKLLPAVKGRTVNFESHSAPIDSGRPAELKTYQQQTMPEKYVEPDQQSSANVAANKPQAVREPAPNLMEVLARQSSHRNKRKD